MNYKKAIAKFDIIDKNGKNVSFALNGEQSRFIDDMSGKDIILKSRQIGFSSLILAMFTVDFLTIPNSRSVIISHDKEAVTALLDRVKYFIQSAELKGLQTKFKYNSRHEIQNELNGSSIFVGTASKSFRGETITNLHLSELAFYDDPQAVFAGAVQAVVPNGRVLVESTANGMTWFRSFYYRSKEGETGYKCHFYSRDFYPFEFLESKRKELMNDDLFNQEYPSTEKDAFISSGRPFFDLQILEWYRNMCKEPILRGMLYRTGNGIGIQPESNGYWKIWIKPQPDYQYVIGADVGEISDYSVASVINQRTKEVVATFRGHLDAAEYGYQLALAGKYYNLAIIAPEKNGLGMGVLTTLKLAEYPNIYTRKSYDKITDTTTDQVGFLTTSSTRPLILSDLQSLLHGKELKIFDSGFIDELGHFVRNEKTGKPEAEKGSHDDRVMSLAIASRILQESPINDDSWDDALFQLQTQQEMDEINERYRTN